MRNPPRGFAYAHFRLDGLPEIHLYSVHLKSNSGGIAKTAPKREEAARQLVAHSGKATGDGVVIITGDLNTDPTRPDWNGDLKGSRVSLGREEVGRENIVSWLSDGGYPDAASDHILVKGNVEVSDAQTMKTARDVSDHRAVRVLVE